MKGIYLGLILFCILVSGKEPASEELADSLMFYASFENTLTANFSTGKGESTLPTNLLQKIEYISGVKGMAVKGYISYPTKGNILPERGTVMFWLQPITWLPDNGYSVNFFNTGHGMREGKSVSMIQLYKYQKYPPRDDWISNKLIFYVAREDKVDGKFVSRYESSKNPVDIFHWKTDQWHHIAFSWDKSTGLVKLYIDGFLILTERMPLPDYFTEMFHVGDQEYISAFDELRIYNRPLTLQEIRAILISEKTK
ncbi:MAG: LamG domain-containing protein [Candidatus Omnitrophica bacterium]|nr:LamG domain-containing protein [Candidatus Omnitrophota bacterium]